ncbi:hypothetical protein CU023_2248 [Enterococcus faecium]|nr:hypothetical protein [Enterococcus faecium]
MQILLFLFDKEIIYLIQKMFYHKFGNLIFKMVTNGTNCAVNKN